MARSCAAKVNWFDSVLILLDAGADYQIKNEVGSDLAELCVYSYIDPEFPEARRDRRKVAKYLEEKGIDLEPIKKKILADRKKKYENLKSQGKSIRESYLDLDLGPEDITTKKKEIIAIFFLFLNICQ